MKRRISLALVLVGLGAPWVSAQIRAGGEFRVNSWTTSSQSRPSLASTASGGFVVVWTSLGQDGSGFGILGRRYDAAGSALGTEFQVNSYTFADQYRATVASDAAGEFVVVWGSYPGQDGSGFGVFGQRFDASGTALGGEFQVNSYTTSWQWIPSVASDQAGGFVVVWESYFQEGDVGVFGQRFDASGARLGAEFQVNSYTTGYQEDAAVASSASGAFVVVWATVGPDGSGSGISARRYDASGVPQGGEFQVNTYTTGWQIWPTVACDPAGNFVVAWAGYYQDGSGFGVFGQRFDASGVRRGAEFRVNTYTTSAQDRPAAARDAVGNFVVTWVVTRGGGLTEMAGQLFDAAGARRGGEFQVNSYTPGYQVGRAVASDAVGNFVVAWQSMAQDGDSYGVFAQRFGGLLPAALAVDAGGNRVLEANELADVMPSWKNVNGAGLGFSGAGSIAGPAATGVAYQLPDAVGAYPVIANGATAPCSGCYQVEVQSAGTRPATHWDAALTEVLPHDVAGAPLGLAKAWSLHVGESFTDVPKTNAYYRFVETVLHRGIASGCTASGYCPDSSSNRQQMSIFALLAKEGASYSPQPCGATPMFADVPVTSPYCRWIEEIARRGVAGGCGGGNFCPAAAVTRGQMPIFVLRTLDPAFDPPACGTPMFADLPATSPYCKWVEELARRGVVGGCGGGNYCPSASVNRAQMAVFISGAFGLTLYGP